MPEFKNEEWNDSGLKDYILTYTSDKQQVQPHFFEQATVENTDLLREIVHHTNYKKQRRRQKTTKRALQRARLYV